MEVKEKKGSEPYLELKYTTKTLILSTIEIKKASTIAKYPSHIVTPNNYVVLMLLFHNTFILQATRKLDK